MNAAVEAMIRKNSEGGSARLSVVCVCARQMCLEGEEKSSERKKRARIMEKQRKKHQKQ